MFRHSQSEKSIDSPAPVACARWTAASAATAAAHVWVPGAARGYAAAEIAARIDNGIGTSKWDLDTPALCVDLDRLERNIATMQAAAKRFGIATRPHAKTHKSADIARMQLAAGAIGICTAKLGEAAALMAEGVDRICMEWDEDPCARDWSARTVAIRADCWCEPYQE